MDIELNNKQKICLTWGGAGLRVDLVQPPLPAERFDDVAAHWPILATAMLSGPSLVQFLETFCVPMLRRALHIALVYPVEKYSNKKLNNVG